MEAIKEIVYKVIQDWAAKKKELGHDSPQALCERLFTKQELGHVQFGYLRKGTLSLKVDSSAWLYHLSLKKADLLAKLRHKSKTVIQDIRFYLGKVQWERKN